MKKRGQIQSQVFIYILSIIIISMIFLFGYRSINYILHRADQVELAELKIDLAEAIDRLGYDSSTNVDLVLPGKFTKICFADIDKYRSDPFCNGRFQGSPKTDYIIDDAVTSNTSNVFLISNDVTEEQFYLGKVSLYTQGCVCNSTQGGRVTINLLGRGDKVEIKFV